MTTLARLFLDRMATPRKRTFRQWLQKNGRDLRVLLRAFSRPLLLFVGTLIVFGLLYFALADLTDLPRKPGPIESIFLILQMIFLQANVDFPEPDNPVITVKELIGISTSIFFKLCSRAPRICI